MPLTARRRRRVALSVLVSGASARRGPRRSARSTRARRPARRRRRGCRPSCARDLGRGASSRRRCRVELRTFVELPLRDDPRQLLDGDSRRRARWAKVRTGGVTPDAFPSARRRSARFIARCAELSVPFKATAGLHHPLRGELSAHLRDRRAARRDVRLPERLRSPPPSRRCRLNERDWSPSCSTSAMPPRSASTTTRLRWRDSHASTIEQIARARALARARVRFVLLPRAGRRPARARAPVTQRIDDTHRAELARGSSRRTRRRPTSRSRICRSASSARARSRRASRRRDRRPDPRSRRGARSRELLDGDDASIVERVCRRGRAQSAARGRAERDARACAAALSRAAPGRYAGRTRGAQARASAARADARERELLLPARDRRLHRLLRVDPPRDERRQHVPAGQSAAAELQVGADRLSRPRVVDRAERHAGASAVRADARRATPRRRRSVRAGASTTSSRSARSSRRGNALGAADPDRRGRSARRRPVPRERLVGARHPDVGVPAARTVPREEFRDDDLAVGRDARRARAVPRARRSRAPPGDPAAAPVSRTTTRTSATGGFAITLEVRLSTQRMRDGGRAADAREPRQLRRRCTGRRRSSSRTTRATAATSGRAICSRAAR